MRVFLAVLATISLFGSIQVSFAEERLVVHEWGVLIRTATTAGSMLVAPAEMLADLPSFVVKFSLLPLLNRQFPRVHFKPVIHFYGPQGTKIDIRVRTAQGQPLVYWPEPHSLEQSRALEDMESKIDLVTDMCWQGVLANQPPKNLPAVKEQHWWASARKIPSKYFETKSQSERFIFYEATSFQEPAVTASVSLDRMVLHNADSRPSRPVVLIVNDGVARYAHLTREIPAKGDLTLSKKEFLALTAGEERILEICREQWRACGMTTEEARHIVEVWKQDLLATPGFLLISAVPTDQYERVFPLTMDPRPDEMIRVCLVFDHLYGQGDRGKWLPDLGGRIVKWAGELSDEDFRVRMRAARRLGIVGDLARTHLLKLAESEDMEARSIALRLLKRLDPMQVTQTPRAEQTDIPVNPFAPQVKDVKE